MGAQQVPLGLDGQRWKRCSMCGEVKALDAFAYESVATGRRQAHCRECHAAYRHEHYLRNKATYVARAVAQISTRYAANRDRVIAYLREHPCVDCGEADIVVLEFDHREAARKKRDVTFLAARRSWSTVEREIAKCDVRCGNCHRRRTARQFSWRKTLAEAAL